MGLGELGACARLIDGNGDYFGLALQYFSLRVRRSGATLMALFMFLVWLVPLAVAAVIGLGASPDSALAVTILAMSPITGVALSSAGLFALIFALVESQRYARSDAPSRACGHEVWACARGVACWSP